MDDNIEDFYNRLKIELNNNITTWPSEYLFKFIVPQLDNNVEKVENAFNRIGAVIKTTQSKTGKFTSLSIHVMMDNADEIIKKYKEVSEIKGIVSL